MAFSLKTDLTNLSEAIKCEPSHDGFIEQFQIEKLYVVNGKDIKVRAKKGNKQPNPEKIEPVADTPQNKRETTEDKQAVHKQGAASPHSSQSQINAPDVALQQGVYKNDDGKLGFVLGGNKLLDAQYDEITPSGSDRLIVKKGGKYGLFSIEGGEAKLLVGCLLNGLKGLKNHKYCINYDGYVDRLNEEKLSSVLTQTSEHLVVRTDNGDVQILFQSKIVGEYLEVAHLGKEVFIAKNHDNKYGLIRCRFYNVETIRPFEYNKIELSEDKRNVLLYKTGRTRFISLHALMNK